MACDVWGGVAVVDGGGIGPGGVVVFGGAAVVDDGGMGPGGVVVFGGVAVVDDGGMGPGGGVVGLTGTRGVEGAGLTLRGGVLRSGGKEDITFSPTNS